MHRLLIRRVGQGVFVVLLVLVATFGMLRISGDPGSLLLPTDATAEERERLREEFGLNDPVPVQFALYLGRAVQGDFGSSIRFRRPAMDLVMERLPATLELVGYSTLLAVLVGLPLGVYAAVKRGRLADTVTVNGVLLGLAIPHFWFAIMLIIIFGVMLGWLPTSGRGDALHLVLPIVSLSVSFLPEIVMLVRSEMVTTLAEPYIQTARSKGLTETRVRYRHALRNALIPVVTVVGMNMGTYIGGAVITETIFAWPGVGQLAIQGVHARDFPLVQATVVVLATAIVVINLLVDLVYGWLDPRIRAQ
jgi:peptide/nickel transport system permease protein